MSHLTQIQADVRSIAQNAREAARLLATATGDLRQRALANMPDALGRVLQGHTQPDGLQVQKVSVPLGASASFMSRVPM